MVYTSIDICIMYGFIVYLAIGIFVCCKTIKRIYKDKKISKHNIPLDKYANDHWIEVFIITFAWPLYLAVMLIMVLGAWFITLLKR